MLSTTYQGKRHSKAKPDRLGKQQFTGYTDIIDDMILHKQLKKKLVPTVSIVFAEKNLSRT